MSSYYVGLCIKCHLISIPTLLVYSTLIQLELKSWSIQGSISLFLPIITLKKKNISILYFTLIHLKLKYSGMIIKYEFRKIFISTET